MSCQNIFFIIIQFELISVDNIAHGPKGTAFLGGTQKLLSGVFLRVLKIILFWYFLRSQKNVSN